MRPNATPSHLVRIEPLPPGEAGCVLSLSWKVAHNASLLLIPALLAGMLVPLLAMLAWFGPEIMLPVAGVSVPTIFAVQVAWAGTYPEWPLNRWLLWRLRRRTRRRLPSERDDWLDSARMVEWVPRENWNTTKLDTAEDVMLIRIGPSGVNLEGDFARYFFPPEAIIDARVTSIRPTGCFHRLHYVVMTVRSEDGPIEFPLAYRDHRFGGLRSRRRLRQTESLCQSIGEIATGQEVDFTDPDFGDRPRVDRTHQRAAMSRPHDRNINPYAVPRS